MAKVVCPNCGYKNKSGTTVCYKCGYYLADNQFTTQKSPVYTAPPAAQMPAMSQMPAQNSYNTGSGTSRVIVIHTRHGMVQWLPSIVSFIPLVIFIALGFLIVLPTYSYIIFIAAILVLSPLTRRLTGSIQFYSRSFRVTDNGKFEVFNYSDIEGVKVDLKNPSSRTLTLLFRNGQNPVTMDFDSNNTFRMTLVQLNRRRIPLSQN